MVTEPDKDPVIIPHPQVEEIVLVTTLREKLVTLQIVQVRSLWILTHDYL